MGTPTEVAMGLRLDRALRWLRRVVRGKAAAEPAADKKPSAPAPRGAAVVSPPRRASGGLGPEFDRLLLVDDAEGTARRMVAKGTPPLEVLEWLVRNAPSPERALEIARTLDLARHLSAAPWSRSGPPESGGGARMASR